MDRYEYRADNQAFRLELVEMSPQQPGPGEVVVRVRATSLNYRDLIAIRNKAGRKVDGVVPLSDGAGEVTSIGEGVTRWKVGDRVAACFFQGWTSGRFDMASHKTDLGGSLNGMLAQEVVLAEGGLVRIPDHLSFEEAACLPCAGLTAWYSMTTRGEIKPGDTVLCLGTGGVSVFALQFGVALGCQVLITSSSDTKLSRARDLGASQTINYRTTPDWDKEVWRLTDKRGVDHVIEVGGPGTFEKSMNSVSAGGHIALIGVLTGFGPPNAGLFPLVSKNARLNGIYVGHRDAFEAMNTFISQKQIRPIIDRVFPYAEASSAFDYLESGNHFGKVVIAHPD
jgi:NADPH:quinone reductase-like Zn-dependent oxidoreductase